MDTPPPPGGAPPGEDHATEGSVGGREERLIRALTGQDTVGMAVLDRNLRVRSTSAVSDRTGGISVPVGVPVAQLVPEQDAEALTGHLREVLKSGTPLVKRPQAFHLPRSSGAPPLVSLSALRLEDDLGRPQGLVVVLTDVTEQERAQRRLDVLFRASESIGGSLDVETTAEELTKVCVPALAGLAAVNLAVEVFRGDDPPPRVGPETGMRRGAVTSVIDASPPYVQPGDDIPPLPSGLPFLERFRRHEVLTAPSRAAVVESLGDAWDPALAERLIPAGGDAYLSVPLSARGMILGSIELWRPAGAEPFDDSDVRQLREIASRGALGIDNARRYTREHNAAVALQRSLLPSDSTDSTVAQTAGVYRPTRTTPGVGGDWYDVIPLSSLRVAFVVGDIVGHGLRATAMMGRLRTVVQALADLDLPPDELLARLDGLVLRLHGSRAPDPEGTLAGSCLCAVYDSLTGHCTLASAGHPPPMLVLSDGTVQVVEIAPGPPLGIGGLPFETTELDIPPGSLLAFYTDGLIGDDGDLATGMADLRAQLGLLRPGDGNLADVAGGLVGRLAPVEAPDDVTLLLARTRLAPDENVVTWDIPGDSAAVATARELAVHQLAEWGLDDMAFSTELIVSELVTNALRYARGPRQLRLIRDRMLTCEVIDRSNTQPRLRRARPTDEGGRGLFLVAQLSARWGSRYETAGKSIWTEQPVTAPAAG